MTANLTIKNAPGRQQHDSKPRTAALFF